MVFLQITVKWAVFASCRAHSRCFLRVVKNMEIYPNLVASTYSQSRLMKSMLSWKPVMHDVIFFFFLGGCEGLTLP